MDYNFKAIEAKWQQYWIDNDTYKVQIDSNKPKYYVLDMFPYPSGAGLHVGHPLGYVASDIFSRYKRLCGYNVLHPMGFDAFGLPAEQYAIETGQHPEKTTADNIATYKKQLGKIGFDYDWSREVITADPDYYKWTQWIFLKLFQSWFNEDSNKAEPIETLVAIFEKEGNENVQAATAQKETFSAEAWKAMSEKEQQEVLMNYRLAYQSYSDVNWCPELGTVLANDEIKDGVSERGGYPVVKKSMRQWFLRITAYAERLLSELDQLDWTDSMKEMQRNWIGKSEGASIQFKVRNTKEHITVFTTRPDTIFGCTFMVLAPEHKLLREITTSGQREEVNQYILEVQSRSERERLTEVKRVTGVFTGSYARHPFTGEDIPIWVADYVLAGYGTGAIMAVPAHDSRDYAFARHFGLDIKEVVEGGDILENAFEAKEGKLTNSDFLDGLEVQEAILKAIEKIEAKSLGVRQINYRLRDAAYSRQRYWGEPFPIYYKDDMPYAMPEDQLPLELPSVDSYKPTEDGDPPLARVDNWKHEGQSLATDTMPGYAGSSWYFFRYMDAQNPNELASKEALGYWKDVDLYIGGTEHATGHLLYSRMWTHFLFDLGYALVKEPFKKLVNQGMIQGMSSFVYRVKDSNKFVSKGLKGQHDCTAIHVDVNLVNNNILDIEAFKASRPDYSDAEFILENDQYICGSEVEKMSKSKLNVVNPDDVIERYGADTFRMYEMFLGPIEIHKPWDTKGIDGVHRFLKKFWKLFYNDNNEGIVIDDAPNDDELKVLHKTIKKIQEDIERLSFNTCVSAFMVCTNELTDLNCHKKTILKEVLILLAPFAPHISEELWSAVGGEGSITKATFPKFEEKYIKEAAFEYPISVNGKMRHKLKLSLDMQAGDVEKEVLSTDEIQKWLEGKSPKKVIVVPGRIVNIVV